MVTTSSGTASGGTAVLTINSLVNSLDTFMTGTPGWTQDELNTGTGRAAWNNGSDVYVSIRWDTSSPTVIAMYQALGWVAATDPGNHTDDSGNGAISSSDSTLDNQRCVHGIDGSTSINYWFYADGTNYIHVVIEPQAGIFRHFGFGELDKIGTWAGGEYCYGHYKGNAGTGTALDVRDTTLLDGLFLDTGTNEKERAATLHIESMVNQAGSSKWANVWQGTGTAPPNDRAGNAKVNVMGGFRGGPEAASLGVFREGNTSGLIPGYPIVVYYFDRTNDPNFTIQRLGTMRDVRGVNMGDFAAKDTVSISGLGTWRVFPYRQKTSDAVTNRSYNSGIMYRET